MSKHVDKIKSKDNYLKVANFRLSIEDLKAIDKKGRGKNSSEKLRYLIHKFKNEKTNILKRRKAYNQIKNDNLDEAENFFLDLYKAWTSLNKNEFLMQTPLKKDIRQAIELYTRGDIEKVNSYEDIKKFGWFIQNIEFDWEDTYFSSCNITFAKNLHVIEVPITQGGEEIIIKEKGEVINDNIIVIPWISFEEEDIFSCFYEELQNKFFYNPQDEYKSSFYSKKYSNGDIYKTIEYQDIVIAEMDYSEVKDISIITYVKGFFQE